MLRCRPALSASSAASTASTAARPRAALAGACTTPASPFARAVYPPTMRPLHPFAAAQPPFVPRRCLSSGDDSGASEAMMTIWVKLEGKAAFFPMRVKADQVLGFFVVDVVEKLRITERLSDLVPHVADVAADGSYTARAEALAVTKTVKDAGLSDGMFMLLKVATRAAAQEETIVLMDATFTSDEEPIPVEVTGKADFKETVSDAFVYVADAETHRAKQRVKNWEDAVKCSTIPGTYLKLTRGRLGHWDVPGSW